MRYSADDRELHYYNSDTILSTISDQSDTDHHPMPTQDCPTETGYEHVKDLGSDDDIANRIVTIFLFISLLFFTTLMVITMTVIAITASKYGFILCVFVGCLVTTFVIIGYYVQAKVTEDRIMEPVRRKMKEWVVEEINNIRLDMNDHMLLEYDVDEGTHESPVNDASPPNNNAQRQKPRRKRARSALFRLLYKPFLKKRYKEKRLKQIRRELEIV